MEQGVLTLSATPASGFDRRQGLSPDVSLQDTEAKILKPRTS